MKPEFSKPFDLDHARAGALYGCKDGQHAEILKWDCKHPHYPLIGVICENGFHYPESWTASGTQANDEEIERRTGCDLVMLPLGLIDGKPVYVGDAFLWHDGTPNVATAEMAGGDWGRCAWPAPAKVYPVTTMIEDDIISAYYSGGPVNGHKEETQAFFRIANAALRHEIDAGTLVTAEDSSDAYMQCSRDLGKAERLLEALGYRSAGDGDWHKESGGDPIHIVGIVNIGSVYGSKRAIDYVSNCISEVDRRAARDMAVAEAVREAARSHFKTTPAMIPVSTAYGNVSGIDLRAIIASVAP